MKRVIVTGATGFVGAGLTRRLLREGHEVHLLVRPGFTTWRLEGIREDSRLHEVVFSDAEALEQTVAEIRPEWIFHLAAYGAYSHQTDWRRMVDTNITGTGNLLHACLKTGFEAFINTGSSSEYGFKDHAPSEDELLEPNSDYAVTKASATLFCQRISRSHSHNIITLRLYSVYGPYEEPTRLIPSLIRHGLQGEYPPLVHPNTARDFIYLDDVCDAYLLAASTPHQNFGTVYNVGSGVQTTLGEVVDAARRLFRIARAPQWGSMSNRAWDTHIWLADNHKIRQALGWQPRISFEEGLAKTAAWMQAETGLHEVYSLH
jgi:nucleoside-diphosphate-sugar epimerase